MALTAYQSVFTPASDANMRSTAKYESIIVPQTIDAGALTVSFKIGTRSFSWTMRHEDTKGLHI